jgi:hypothetical protein
MKPSDESGIEELRRAVRTLDRCRESWNETFTAAELLLLVQAVAACEWDIFPDQLTEADVARALRGEPIADTYA